MLRENSLSVAQSNIEEFAPLVNEENFYQKHEQYREKREGLEKSSSSLSSIRDSIFQKFKEQGIWLGEDFTRVFQ